MSRRTLWWYCQRLATLSIRSPSFGPTRRADIARAGDGRVGPRPRPITAADASLVAETTHFAIPLTRCGLLPFRPSAPPPGAAPEPVAVPRDRDTAPSARPTADTVSGLTSDVACRCPVRPQAPDSRPSGWE